jgi:hypothetical protein
MESKNPLLFSCILHKKKKTKPEYPQIFHFSIVARDKDLKFKEHKISEKRIEDERKL